jgi:hypothetical protein
MHRARQRSLAALGALSLVCLAPAPARAFHAGSLFDKPPGAGGGGGLFYTGAIRDKGWDCTACHIDPPGKIQLRLYVDPPDLFQGFRYTPGQTYSFNVVMEGESVGLGSPLSNYNTLAISIVGPTGAPVGSMSGFAAEEFYTGWPTTIVSGGQRVGATSWTFQWIAGGPGAGAVTIFIAAVDGNGANSPPGQTLTDPFGDDVYVGTVLLEEGAVTASADGASPGDPRRAGFVPPRIGAINAAGPSPEAPRQTAFGREDLRDRAPAGVGALACAVGLAAAGASRRRRIRPRGAGEPS